MAACSISNAGLLGNYGGIKSNRNACTLLATRCQAGHAPGERIVPCERLFQCVATAWLIGSLYVTVHVSYAVTWLAEKLGK